MATPTNPMNARAMDVAPDAAGPDADEREAKQELVARLLAAADRQGLNNAQAARAAGVRRADFSMLRNGKADGHSIGWRMQALGALEPGLRVRLVVEPRGGATT